MKHIGLDLEDFNKYYNSSFIKTTDGEVVQVAAANRDNNTIIVMRPDGSTAEMKYDSITWDNVKIPSPLGYINLGDTGEFVYHCTLRTGRITSKGMQSNTMYISVVRPLYSLYENLYYAGGGSSEFKGRLSAYRASAKTTHQIMREIYNPKYPSLLKAISLIRGKGSFGFALSPRAAIVTSIQHNFALYVHEQLVASSEDGVKWEIDNPNLEPIIKREVGELRYV